MIICPETLAMDEVLKSRLAVASYEFWSTSQLLLTTKEKTTGASFLNVYRGNDERLQAFRGSKILIKQKKLWTF